MKVVHCPCGKNIEGETDDTLVENVEQHISADHPGPRRQVLTRGDSGDGARTLSRSKNGFVRWHSGTLGQPKRLRAQK